jgi:hypothetical protein
MTGDGGTAKVPVEERSDQDFQWWALDLNQRASGYECDRTDLAWRWRTDVYLS